MISHNDHLGALKVQAAQEKQRQINGPLAKELAKLVISLRGGPQIS
jgi:hypothetical protein